MAKKNNRNNIEQLDQKSEQKEEDVKNLKTVSDEISPSEIEEKRLLIQKKIQAMKNELENPDINYPYYKNEILDLKEYIERLENVTDDEIKNQIIWEKENQRKQEETHKQFVEDMKKERESWNSPKEEELLSYNQIHPVFTLTNKETGRMISIQPTGKIEKNIKRLGRLKNLTEAKNTIEKIKASGFDIYSTQDRVVLFNEDKFYDFDDYAGAGHFNFQTEEFEFNIDNRNLKSWDFKSYIKGGLKITKRMKAFEKIEDETAIKENELNESVFANKEESQEIYFNDLSPKQKEEVINGYRSADDPNMLSEWENLLRENLVQIQKDNPFISSIDIEKETSVSINPPTDEWISEYLQKNKVNFNTEFWQDIFAEIEMTEFTNNLQHEEEDFFQGKDQEEDELASNWANDDFERTQRLNEIISEIKKSDFKLEVSVENNLRKVVLTNKNGDEIFSEKETGNSIMPIASRVAVWSNDTESKRFKNLVDEYFNIISEDRITGGDFVNKVFEKEENPSLEEIVNQLEMMEVNIRNENGWISGDDIVSSNDNARKYLEEIKSRTATNLELDLGKEGFSIFTILEADNYHTLNDALGILGIYGKEYQQKVLENLEKYPNHLLLPLDVAKEFVNDLILKNSQITPVSLEEILSVMEMKSEVTYDGKIKIYDQQRQEYIDNRSILSDSDEDNIAFDNAAEIFERLNTYINDYFITDIEEQLEAGGVTLRGDETLKDLCDYAKKQLEAGITTVSQGELNLAMGIVNPKTVIMPEGFIEKENKIMTKKEIIDYYVTQQNDRKMGRFGSYESMMIDWKDFIENLYMSDAITEKQRDSLTEPCTETGFEKFNERFESNVKQKVEKEPANDYDENHDTNKNENNISFFVKDTAEFEQFAQFEAIKNLTAEEAVKTFIENKEKNFRAGIGINIPGDFIFNDPNCAGAIVLDETKGKVSFYMGDSFVKELKENNEHSQNVIKAFKELDEAVKKSSIFKDGLYEEPTFLFDKEKELGLTQWYETVDEIENSYHTEQNSKAEQKEEDAKNLKAVSDEENAHRKFIDVQDIRSIHGRTLIAKNEFGNYLLRTEKPEKLVINEYEKEEKQSRKNSNDILRSVEQLEIMEINIRNENGWISADDILASNDSARKYLEEIKRRTAADLKLGKEEFSILKGDNYHTFNDALGILGVYGKEYQQAVLERLEKYPSHFYLPFDVAKEFVNGQGYTMYDEKKTSIEQNDDYIRSEEFISKFGNWEKANRLEKLRNAEPIIKDGKSSSELTANELKNVKTLLPKSQYQVVLEYTQGDEGEHFKDIIKEISSKAEAIKGKREILTDDKKHPLAFKYTLGTSSFYFSEWDGEDELFGYTILNGDTQMSEWGYTSLEELKNITCKDKNGFPVMPEMIFYGLEDTIEKQIAVDYPELSEKMGFAPKLNHNEELISEFGKEIFETLQSRKLEQNAYNICCAAQFIIQTMDSSEKKEIFSIMEKCGCKGKNGKSNTEDFLTEVVKAENNTTSSVYDRKRLYEKINKFCSLKKPKANKVIHNTESDYNREI